MFDFNKNLANKGLSRKEIERYLAEYFDENKVVVFCGKHLYMPKAGVAPPENGCKECSQAYLRYLVCKMPPHRREEGLALLEKVIRDMVQSIESGEYDVRLGKPVITKEKA